MTDDDAGREGRRWVAAGCLACTAFFVYGSLVPLHWTPQGLGAAWQFFWNLPAPEWRAEGRIDVAVNFLLTLPQAFALTHLAATQPRRGARICLMAGVWPLLAMLSLGVEFAQVFFPPRDPSWTDVTAQWAGTAAGILAYVGAGARFRPMLAGLAPHNPVRVRQQRWLYVYLGLLLAFSVAPLDLSLSPGELYRKWRDGGVLLIPFGATTSDAWQFAYDLATDALLWVPVGLLWKVEGSGASTLRVVGRVLIAATFVEFAQLLVLSRVSDTTDVLLAGSGGFLGAVLAGWLREWEHASTAWQARCLAAVGCAWFAMALVLLWAPFNFSLHHVSAQSLSAAVGRLPFETYLFRGEFAAFNEMLRKILVFLPGGLVMGTWASRKSGKGTPVIGLVGLWLLALLLEAGQLMLPGKVADLTDAVLGRFGAWLGWRITRSLAANGRHDSRAVRALAAKPIGRRVSPAAAEPPRVRPLAAQALWVVGGLALAFWLAARLPGVPYNVTKLVPGGSQGALSATGMAPAAWWILAAPLFLIFPGRHGWRGWLPLLLVVHGGLSYVVLRATVPLPMLHKIIGSPVLAWGGFWEDMFRYLALHAWVMLPLLGAALVVRAVQRPSALVDVVVWSLFMVLLVWPLHWVVVERAATDNLIELMRGRGSLAATMALMSAWGLLALAGSALAAATQHRGRWLLLALAVASLALAPAMFVAGLEPVVVKYGRAFSALQFIVSAERSQYANGLELTVRAGAAMVGTVLFVAAAQILTWRALAAADADGRSRVGALTAA